MPPAQPAKKIKPPSVSAAAQLIKKYLDNTNRPWSVTNIVDSLAPKTGLNATGAKNALKELCDSAQIDFKIYGKQTVRVLWPASLLRLRPSAPRLTTRTRLATRASST